MASASPSPWLALWLTSLLAQLVSAGHHASIKSEYGQLVTSTTLKWRQMSARRGGMMPKDAVPSGTGNPSKVICRAEHHGSLLVGQTTPLDGTCAVGFINKIYEKQKFEVLINIGRSARLEWRPYSKFNGAPQGAVAGVDESSAGSASGDRDIFIGRHLSDETRRYRPGTVEVPRRMSLSSFGSMLVYDETAQTMLEYSSGDVLVEIEPVGYELEIHEEKAADLRRFSKMRRKVTRKDTVLAKSSLFRFDEGRDTEARLQKVLSYNYEKSEYYGQVPGMIRALPTQIQLSNGESQSLLWGLPESSVQKETMMVGHALKHYSAVDVTVVGEAITEEIPYKGTLTAHFDDGTRRTRNNVNGVLQRKYLNNIRPEYSRVYKIKDSIVVSSSSGSATTPAPPSQSPTRRKSYFYEDSGGGGGKGHDRTKDTSVTSSSSPWVSGGGSSERRRVREETDRGRLHQQRQQMLSDQTSSGSSQHKEEQIQLLRPAADSGASSASISLIVTLWTTLSAAILFCHCPV